MTDVATPAREYDTRAEVWALIEALRGGTAAMRAAGARYLPRFSAEDPRNWSKRLGQAVLFPAFDQTVTDLVGLPFSKPIRLSEDVPDPLRALVPDMDTAGRHLDVFARAVFDDGLAKGSSHILVDMPPLEDDEPLTLAAQQARRPYWTHVRPEQLIDARIGTRQGRERFTHVRIRETVTRHDGYGEKQVQRIREITPPEYRIWEKNDKGWAVVESGPYGLPFVPLAPFLAGRDKGLFTARPPLENLAYQNVAHWQSASDQQNILAFARLAILALVGVEEADNLAIGPASVLRLPATADAKFVEHSGAAISAGERDLETRKAEMAVAGSQLLVKRPRPRTATEVSVDAIEEQSELQAMVIDFTDCLNTAWAFTANWLGLPTAGSLGVNDRFAVAFNGDRIKDVVLGLRAQGDIAVVDALTELRAAGLLSDGFDVAAALQNLRAEKGAA